MYEPFISCFYLRQSHAGLQALNVPVPLPFDLSNGPDQALIQQVQEPDQALGTWSGPIDLIRSHRPDQAKLTWSGSQVRECLIRPSAWRVADQAFCWKSAWSGHHLRVIAWSGHHHRVSAWSGPHLKEYLVRWTKPCKKWLCKTTLNQILMGSKTNGKSIQTL